MQDGDSVVMFGDSITEQRFYTVDVEFLVTTRFPKLKINWTAARWSGMPPPTKGWCRRFSWIMTPIRHGMANRRGAHTSEFVPANIVENSSGYA